MTGKEKMENIVYIPRKPTMNYVPAVVAQFNNGMREVTIKARGNSISRAVDVKESHKQVLPGLKERGIKTSSEELTNEDARSQRVSLIDR